MMSETGVLMNYSFQGAAICILFTVTVGWGAEPPAIQNTHSIPVKNQTGVSTAVSGGALQKKSEPYIQFFRFGAGDGKSGLEVLEGERFSGSFSWNVTSGTVPSPIQQINISRSMGSGPNINTSLPTERGDLSLSIPGETPVGETVYTLTAINQDGNMKSSSTTLKVLSRADFASKLQLNGATMLHPVENTPFELGLSFSNSSGVINVPVKVYVYAGHFGMGGIISTSRLVALTPNPQSVLIKSPFFRVDIPNCKIPAVGPDEYPYTVLTIDIKTADDKIITSFQSVLKAENKRSYFIDRLKFN